MPCARGGGEWRGGGVLGLASCPARIQYLSLALPYFSTSTHDRREIYQHGAIGVVIETNHRSSWSHRTSQPSGGRGGCLPSDCQSVHSDENTPNLTGSIRSRVVILHQEDLSRVSCDKNSNWPTEKIQSLPHITSTQRQPGAQISSVQSVEDETAGLEEPEKNSSAGSTPLRLTPPTAPRPRRLPTPDLSEVCFLGEQILCGCQSK